MTVLAHEAPPMGAVNLITLPHLDPRERVRTTALAGSSIAEMVAQALPGATPDMVRTTIGDQIILPENRARVRPKVGAVVIIRAVPRGDRDMLRSVLLIAVTIAAVAVGQLWLGPLIAGQAGLGFAIGSTAFNATVGITSSALAPCATLDINTSIPIRS